MHPPPVPTPEPLTIGGPPEARADKQNTVTEDVDRPNAIVANARREFMSVFGDLAHGKRNWQLMAFGLGAVVVLQAFAVLRLMSAAHPVPYVVEVDRLGTVSAVASAEQMGEPDERLVASQLASFVRSVRTVLPAIAGIAQADLLRRGYSFLSPTAAAFLNNYFADPSHDPRVLGAHVARDVRVTAALRLPEQRGARGGASAHRPQTWRLQWIETGRPVGPLDAGDSVAVTAWEAYVTLELLPPRTADSIQDNPLGLRITSIAWTQVAAQNLASDSLHSVTSSTPEGGIR